VTADTSDPFDPPSSPSDPPWNEIRAAYEGSDLAVAAIARAYAVTPERIWRRARREAWPRRRGAEPGAAAKSTEPLDRGTLVARLFRAVERQIAEVERRFDGAAPASLEEKDARTLGALARTLELLIGLEKQAGRDTTEPEPDIDAFRLDLARRLESLRRAE
jgi:hypothetical protein